MVQLVQRESEQTHYKSGILKLMCRWRQIVFPQGEGKQLKLSRTGKICMTIHKDYFALLLVIFNYRLAKELKDNKRLESDNPESVFSRTQTMQFSREAEFCFFFFSYKRK